MTPSSADASPSVRYSPGFRDSVLCLTKPEQNQVNAAVMLYLENPALPGLKLKKLRGKSPAGQLWSMRASQELRILLRRNGLVADLVHAGHHDEALLKAALIGPAEPAPPVPEPEAPTAADGDLKQAATRRHDKPTASHEPDPLATPTEAKEQPLLWMWPVDALRDYLDAHRRASAGGNQNDHIPVVSAAQAVMLVRATEDDAEDVLLAGWPGDANAPVRARLLDLLVDLSELPPQEWREAQLTADETAAVERFARDITEKGAAAALSVELGTEGLRQLATAPIEAWMLFLHPDQREIVERSFAGPARVSGSAGTGKTTAALHRAAWLARHPPEADMFGAEPLPILFTTYVKTLVPVLEALYGRLPGSVSGAVTFTNIDLAAAELCEEAGDLRSWNGVQNENAFALAKKEIVKPGTPLHELGCSDDYLREEIQRVIIGRGIDDLDSYLGIDRIGREMPFRPAVREQVWELRLAWRDLMDAKGLEHFEDRIRRARDYARSLAEPRYRTVIVDEAQDLTQTGLELLCALVARRIPTPQGPSRQELGPDSVLIAGDVAQRVYPGGYTLLSAGVDVRGRSHNLGRNYRNTRRIIEAAIACAGSFTVADLEAEQPSGSSPRRSDAARETDTDGVPPRLVIAADKSGERRWVAAEIARLRGADTGGLALGDFGVFAARNDDVEAAVKVLESSGLPVRNLKEPTPGNGDIEEGSVKVGTLDRAKGLEFKVVFLLGISHGAWPFTAKKGLRSGERADAEALAASKLFVGMTRARDALYVLCSEKPHALIDSGRVHFETIRVPVG
ncbi:3'-5' exonuclease [Candidatus Poriferisodalis sp.]|uniref:3'-5' exonuclease n=1 Tax=Candidatus Poriferisodalis sp. TaxID=3101277 RepID=UPI003B01A0E0